jgi:nucleoside-diphosphate-sugar epimerase
MSVVLVTGASGFVGRHVVAALRAAGHSVRCAVRATARGRALPADIDRIEIPTIGAATDWTRALDGVGAVVHLAARAHVLEERAADPLAAFLEVNTAGTLALARSAADAGVRRFLFLSSIKVNGESSGEGAFGADDVPAPVDPYGVSKWRAETGLADIARGSSLETTIVRPPLVYGPGVGANFLRLLRLVDRGLPLPVGGVRNARSLVSVWNLTDLLLRCLTSPHAANRTFMVSDGRDLSTAELVRMLAAALGKPARLVSVPPAALRLAARLTGQMAEYTRLCASLRVNMGATTSALDWSPPCTVEESLRRTVAWYRDGARPV